MNLCLNQQQEFDYFMILDFEATCSETDRDFQNEVIEFPIVVLNSRNGKIEAEFREYVRPRLNTVLTGFCTKLTGIEQETVDKAEAFPVVFANARKFYDSFLIEHPDSKTIFVTCGDWDLQKMLSNQARLSDVKVPWYLQEWINIKIPFKANHASFSKGTCGGFGMASMLESLNLPLIGRHHCGLDDSRNIAAITYALIKKGIVLKKTTEWSPKLKRQLSEPS